jgi:hypothetical protein
MYGAIIIITLGVLSVSACCICIMDYEWCDNDNDDDDAFDKKNVIASPIVA